MVKGFPEHSNIEEYFCTSCEIHLISENVADEINARVQGNLLCQKCNKRHPVINGIPRFVPSDTYAGSFGFQWNIHKKTQLDSYTGLPISRKRLFGVSNWPEQLTGQRILEAGSGAGRFTEVLVQTDAEVFSFDYSLAVEANRLNNGGYSNLHLFQGDIFDIPFPGESFDKVICLGVLQHTPDPEQAFKQLSKQLKSGGELVIDIYKENILSRLRWKYLLRPATKRMDKEILYRLVSNITPVLIPFTKQIRKIFGRAGARLSPIVEYTHLGLTAEINKEWAILDTFDMYSPAYDNPRSLKTVRKWFVEAGFSEIVVQYGQNGIIGRGKKG